MRTKICRICQSENLHVIIDYGKVALADSFLSNDEEIDNEQKYDLRLCICNVCKHVQIDEIIDSIKSISNEKISILILNGLNTLVCLKVLFPNNCL